MLPRLYTSVRSPHCFKVSLVLAEKDVEFERIEIDLRAKQQRTPAYLAINPLGQVPVFEDDRGVHIDSLVIMRYLDERYPTPPLFPVGGAELELVLDWIERSSTSMRDVSHHLYWQLVEPPANGPDEGVVADLKAQGIAILGDVEAALREGKGWLTGSLSAADFSVFAWLYGFRRFGLPPDPVAFPALATWLERLTTRPSFAASYDKVGRRFSPAMPYGDQGSLPR
jgi:glutathione S-transferase